MAGYFENTTFGMTGISLSGNTAGTEIFAGATVTKGSNKHASAADAKGLDWGTDAGTFNLKLNFKVRTVSPITYASTSADGTVTFKVYSSSDNATFKEVASYTTTADALNASKLKNNIVFSAVPTMGRYFCIGITTKTACTGGVLLVSCDPKGY